MLQPHHRRHTGFRAFERGLDAQQTKQIAHAGVALLRAVHQTLQQHLVSCVSRQRHHLIPVGSSTPVALDIVRMLLVGLGSDHDGLEIIPVGKGVKLTHRPQRQVDIGSRDDVTLQAQRQSVAQHRTDEQQGRDKLRTDVAGHLQQAAFQLSPTNAQRRKTLLAHVLNVGTQASQGLHQHMYRTVLHALRSRQHVLLAFPRRQIGRHEAHGRTCCLDVDFVGIVAQGTDNHLRVVTVRQVVKLHAGSRQGIDHQRTVRDAFRCGQLHRCCQEVGCRKGVLHGFYTLII